MFYLQYMVSELRRRKGRTLLTALGLGVGVGLVVTVTALTTGLDRAQDKILEPLTGVGTDMAVTRPLTFDADAGNSGRFQGPGAGLSAKEQEQLREENGGAGGPGVRLRLDQAGEPGEKFTRTDFIATSQLSFPASEVARIAGLDKVKDAAGALTLSMTRVSGTVPEEGFGGRRDAQPQDGAQPDDNAAKYGPPDGRIDVTVRGGEVAVRDHGRGVPAADAPLIFDRFYRGDAARGRTGSGLGLAIVRQVAEAHGGSAGVQDAEGGGARFWLRLPSVGGGPRPVSRSGLVAR